MIEYKCMCGEFSNSTEYLVSFKGDYSKFVCSKECYEKFKHKHSWIVKAGMFCDLYTCEGCGEEKRNAL